MNNNLENTEHSCKYCGARNARGTGCPHSPDGVHQHSGANYVGCIYCGATHAYGSGCPHAPPRKNGKQIHKRMSGIGMCVWCGAKNARGTGCPHSPDGIHER